MGRDASFYRWAEMPKERLTDFLDRKFLHGDRLMLAHIYLKKGCQVQKHQHENEQATYVLEGTIRFWLGPNGETERTLKAGDVVMIPGNLPHSAEALEDSLSLDVFGPPRQDWIDGTDAYLREQDPHR